MRRIMQCEFDSRFFGIFGEFFLKSFWDHNKGWELYVVDLGLNQQDKQLLQRYGRVVKYPIDPCSRWPNLVGRILSLKELVRDDNLILRLDTDSIITASYEDVVDMFLENKYEVIAPGLPHSLADRARNLKIAAEILGVEMDNPCLYIKSLTACFTMMRGTPKMAAAFDWLAHHYERLLYAGKEEEPIISATLYRDRAYWQALNWEYFWSIGVSTSQYGYVVPSLNPVTVAGRRIYGVHFAFSKYFMLNSQAPAGHEHWCGWQDILTRKYGSEPWPNPKELV